MEPEGNRLARRICSGTSFGNFEDVSGKREYAVNNADNEVGPAANQRSQNQRLPPMPFTCVRKQTMVQTSPHHIASPPAQQKEEQQGHSIYGQYLMSLAEEHSRRQNMNLHHSGLTGGVMASSVKQNNILMYPNPPSISWDTPPIGNSSSQLVSALSHYNMDQYHSHTQHVHPKAPDMMEGMVCLTQYLRQEHLDLRPNCKGEMGEVQDWSTLVPHHGVISSCKRAHNPEYMQHHGHQDLGPLIPQNQCFSMPLNMESNNFMSPISSSRRSLNSTESSSCDDIINNDLLTYLSEEELNRRVHGSPQEEMVPLKEKLRQYVHNCHTKWMHQKHELEMSNRTLQSNLHRLQMEMNRVAQDRDYFKRRYELRMGDWSTATVETDSRPRNMSGSENSPAVEMECQDANGDKYILIRFPDPVFSKEMIRGFHPSIRNVHFPAPIGGRSCLVKLNSGADVDKVVADLKEISFSSGKLLVERNVQISAPPSTNGKDTSKEEKRNAKKRKTVLRTSDSAGQS